MNKIDFIVIIVAENCNPNGDPLLLNRPRTNHGGYGEMSDVCIKRKIRNRLQDMGQKIFVQTADNRVDNYHSLRDRANGCLELKNEIDKKRKADVDKCRKIACKEWLDVRTFGQVFTLKSDNVSLNVRGPVSITMAKSIDVVDIKDIAIVKSENLDTTDGDRKDSSTMGMKYMIERGVYVFQGAIFPQLASLTGFTEADAELIKEAIVTLFENDATSARPAGSMEISKVYWWEQKGRVHSPAALKRSLSITPTDHYPYYKVDMTPLKGCQPQVIE